MKNNGPAEEAVREMMLSRRRLFLFADTFGIPLARRDESGAGVELYYWMGERSHARVEGASHLEDESPWKVAAPLVRFLYQRGLREMFGLRLIYTEEAEYKLKELLLLE